MRYPTTLTIGLGLSLALAACGGEEAAAPAEQAFTRVEAATLAPGDEVPAPEGEVVLTITGDVTAANTPDGVAFDLETLERVGLVEYEVDDQQAEGRRVTFRGVLLSELLDVAGASDTATTLHTVALNDYAVDIPASDAADYPVMVATSVDGERMPVDAYGPTRIVYPYDAFEFDTEVIDPRWIWQLARIDVA